jgi:hypothetical protein
MKVIHGRPHPTLLGHWLVKAAPGLLPYDVWYTSREHAVSYAKWLARDNHVEVRIHDEKPSWNRSGEGRDNC